MKMIASNEFKKIESIKLLAIIIILLIINVLALVKIKALFLNYRKHDEDIIKKTRELAQGPKVSALKQTVNSEIEQINLKITAIKNKIFPNAGELFLWLNRFAEADKISLKAITPSEKKEIKVPNSNDLYLELPVNIKLECNYYQFLSFLKKIESMKNIILVNKIRVQNNPKNIWEHDIELSLNLPLSAKN